MAGGLTCGLGPFFLPSCNNSYHGIETSSSALYLDPDGEEKVVSELLRAKTEGKMSNNGFKKSTFNEIARGLQITPPVNGTQVQTLFKHVSVSFLYVLAKY